MLAAAADARRVRMERARPQWPGGMFGRPVGPVTSSWQPWGATRVEPRGRAGMARRHVGEASHRVRPRGRLQRTIASLAKSDVDAVVERVMAG